MSSKYSTNSTDEGMIMNDALPAWPYGQVVDGKKLGEVSSVNKSTLRYWTDKGLLEYRRQNGKFLYPLQDNLSRIRFITEMQESKEYYSLSEIKQKIQMREYAKTAPSRPVGAPVWDEASEAKFDSLVKKAALNSITTQEYAELEKLSGLRDAAQNPRTPQEILAEEQREIAFARLMSALNEYSASLGSKN